METIKLPDVSSGLFAVRLFLEIVLGSVETGRHVAEHIGYSATILAFRFVAAGKCSLATRRCRAGSTPNRLTWLDLMCFRDLASFVLTLGSMHDNDTSTWHDDLLRFPGFSPVIQRKGSRRVNLCRGPLRTLRVLWLCQPPSTTLSSVELKPCP